MPIKPTTYKIPDVEKAMIIEMSDHFYGKKFMKTQFLRKLIRDAYEKYKNNLI